MIMRREPGSGCRVARRWRWRHFAVLRFNDCFFPFGSMHMFSVAFARPDGRVSILVVG